MSTKIDGFELNNSLEKDLTKDTITELRTISKVGVMNSRRLLDHRVISSQGSIIADKGRLAMRIAIEGQIWGKTAKQSMQQLRAKYLAGKPMDFESDISLAASIRKVLIEWFRATNTAGLDDYYQYDLILQEHVEQVNIPSKGAAQQAEVQTEIDDIRGQIIDADGQPATGIAVIVSGPDGEMRTQTDSDGYYELLDLKEGKYEITVDAPGYENARREVEIRKDN